MSKQNEPVSVQDVSRVQDSMNYVTVKNEASDLLSSFDKLDEIDLQKVTSEYLTFEKNTKYSFVFNGFTKMNSSEGREIECAVLIDKDNVQHINGNAVLVRALKPVTQLPCFVRIVTGEMVKGKNGNYLDMEVFVLPQSLQK